MEYAIYIKLDKSLKEDYCVLSNNEYDDKTVNLNVYTNGKNKLDFQTINYITYNEAIYKDFITYFSYGRNVINNAKLIHLTNTSDEQKNTKKENRALMKILTLNNEMLNKKIYIDVGSIGLCEEDMDSLKPFKKCKFASVTFDDTNIYHTIDELETLYEIVEEIVSRTLKYDFSPMEQMLYAYDIIRTDFAIDKKYEEKLERIIKFYNEPSYCYALIYKEVLNRLKIKNLYSTGNFYYDTMRAINIAYVKDPEYAIEGVYYFDIGNNSKQRINNSLIDIPSTDSFQNNLINNYISFCKTKVMMEDRGCLDEDHTFGDFGEGFMEIYDYFQEKEGINGIFKLRTLINNAGHFIDGTTVIDSFAGIKSEDELNDIRSATEKYVDLFSRTIDGEDFLEILFNVRKVEYMENKELFPLSTEVLKKCIYNSQFPLSKMLLDFQDDQEYEAEDIDEILQETFDNSFEETINNFNIEERIKTLKLSLNKDMNKPKKDDDN